MYLDSCCTALLLLVLDLAAAQVRLLRDTDLFGGLAIATY